ncbi:DUF4838 domain-containing protein [Horticoccus luteus]|uniref:DUF4838 domain-containing protein n=1 Tax=Horticoccus luteus TaxID=2862869 RepID=A0A8F9XKT7_9BACT|nr:DUF4838 domain-containing protein [Horticoccus luteus]QYM78536.1 DUF4838 domain-containing protein [Horticoccus luteus]
MRSLLQLSCALMAALLFVRAARSQVTLTHDGQPTSVILTATNRSAIVLLAAQELQKHLQIMSGALVPIDFVGQESHYNGKSLIYLGTGVAAPSTAEFYTIRTVGTNLYIVGKDTGSTNYTDLSGCQPGNLFGVYHLLNEILGVRWLWPGDLGIVAPPTPTIIVPATDLTTGPNMVQRKFRNPRDGFYTGGASSYVGTALTIPAVPTDAATRLQLGNEELLWQRRMRMGTRKNLSFGHSETKWWATYGATHPEYFAVLYSGSQPKPAADRVKLHVSGDATIAAKVQEWINLGKPSTFNVCPNDSRNFCVCPECLAWDYPSQPASIINSDSSALLSDRYARWYTELANRIKAIRPDTILYGYAYDVYRKAPIMATVPDNVALAYIPGAASDTVKSQIADTEADVLGWIAHGCTQMYLRPNWMLSAHAGPFWPTYRMGNHFRDMLAGGYLLGLDSDSSAGSYSNFGLYYYMVARLMSKPTITIDQIMDEYCSGFGRAAGRMRDYFSYWENFIYNQADQGNTDILGWSTGMAAYGATYTDAAFDGAEKILDDAVAQLGAGETAARDRIAFLRIACIHGRLTAQALRLTDTTKKTVALRALLAYRNATASTFALWREWLIDREGYGAGLTSLWTAVLATPTIGYGSNAGAFIDSGGQVVLEAEHATARTAGTGTFAGVAWQDNTTTPGAIGTAVQALPNAGAAANETTSTPRLDFTVDFRSTGTWYVWVRLPALAAADDSVNIGLDGAITAKNLQNTSGAWTWTNTGTAGRATINITTIGVHTFNVWMREDGVVLDRILLTNNAAFSLAPTDTGPAESATRATTEHLLVVGSGTGDGYYGESSFVALSADPAPANYIFDRWVGDTAGLLSPTSANTTLAMPAADTRVDASYKLSPSADSDGDGILDAWELAHFGNLTTANATSDTDGDGVTDHDEFLAGTDPNDPNSRLRITSMIKNAQGDIVLQWPGVAGKTYRLMTTTDLQSGQWTPISVDIAAVTPVTTYTVRTSSPRLFLRVEVE